MLQCGWWGHANYSMLSLHLTDDPIMGGCYAMLRGGVAEAASTPLLPTVLCNLRTGDTGILGLGILGLSLQPTPVFVCIKTDSKLIV